MFVVALMVIFMMDQNIYMPVAVKSMLSYINNRNSRARSKIQATFHLI